MLHKIKLMKRTSFFFGISPIMLVLIIFILTLSKFTTIQKPILLFIICIFIILTLRKSFKFNIYWKINFGLIIYLMFLMFLYLNSKSIYYFFVIIISFSYICMLSNGKISEEYLKEIGLIIKPFYIIFCALFFFAFVTGKVAMEGESFALGIYQPLVCISIFLALSEKHYFIPISITAIIVFLSGERGLMILLIMTMFFKQIFMRPISKRKFKFMIVLVLIACIAFQFIYVNLQETDIGIWLNETSRQYTNQNFFSGRNNIWKVTNDVIFERPFFGFGLGNTVLAEHNIFMSAHNTYIDILLKGGISLLILICMFIYKIECYFYNYLSNKIIQIIAAFLLGVLVFSTTGVIITGNDMLFTILIWTVVGCGIMLCNNEKRKI